MGGHTYSAATVIPNSISATKNIVIKKLDALLNEIKELNNLNYPPVICRQVINQANFYGVFLIFKIIYNVKLTTDNSNHIK